MSIGPCQRQVGGAERVNSTQWAKKKKKESEGFGKQNPNFYDFYPRNSIRKERLPERDMVLQQAKRVKKHICKLRCH